MVRIQAGKLLGPILVQAVQNCAEKVLQSFVVPGASCDVEKIKETVSGGPVNFSSS